IALEILKRSTNLGYAELVAFGVIAGVFGGLLTLLVRAARDYLRYLAFAVPVFSLLFLAASPVSPVVFGGRVAAVASVHISSPRRVVVIVMDEFPEMS